MLGSPPAVNTSARSAPTLHRLQHGVYLLAGVPHDPLTELKAAWLGLEPGGIVSHRSAAKVHHLGDLDADLNEFTVTTPRRTRHRDTRLYKRTLARADWEIVDGLPTTTVAATVRDLASTTIDGGHLAGVIRDALLHGQLTYDDTAVTLRPHAHHYGAPSATAAHLSERCSPKLDSTKQPPQQKNWVTTGLPSSSTRQGSDTAPPTFCYKLPASSTSKPNSSHIAAYSAQAHCQPRR